MKKIVFLLLFVVQLNVFSEIIIRPYLGYTLWIDTERKGPVFFMYTIGPDIGNFDERNYKLDDWIPDEFEQVNITTTYNSVHPGWDFGHLVPLNHLDSNLETAMATEYMLDIVPQASYLNRHGTWRETERIIECYREDNVLLVIGGVIWGNDTSNDYFIESHGIETPDIFWKAIILGDEIIAWIIPNIDEKDIMDEQNISKYELLNSYICSLNDIKEITEIPILIPDFLCSQTAATSWPINCVDDWEE